MNDEEILNKAVAALNSTLYHEKAIVDYHDNQPYLTVMGKRFVCIIEPNLTLGKMVEKIQSDYRCLNQDVRYLYVTVNATPKMLELAKLPYVNILDCAGNFNIQYQLNTGDIVLMLANKGERPVENLTSKGYPIFMEKGLRVIFHLLTHKGNIRRPYREIVEATNVAIGTVKNVIDGMIHHQYARVEANKRFLINTDRLLALWTANYGQILKPKLLRARFVFRDETKRRNWKEMRLPDGMIWGGEPAAALTDGFLTPGEFTVYTEVPAATLMKTGAVTPDPNGDIIVYEKFWAGKDTEDVTPAILTYADLMDNANGRSIEAAQKIKQNELKDLL